MVTTRFNERIKEVGLNTQFTVETDIPKQLKSGQVNKIGADLLYGFNITRFNKETEEYELVREVDGLFKTLNTKKLCYLDDTDMRWEISGEYDFKGFVYNYVGPELVNKEGKFTKRLPAKLKKAYGIKLTPAQRTHIGNIIANNGEVLTHEVITADITDNLDWKQGEFYDTNPNGGSSCFWSEYKEARYAMDEDSRFYALRFWEKERVRWKGTGRCWVCIGDNSVILFNRSHPEYRLMTFAEVMAKFLDYEGEDELLVKGVKVHNHGSSSGLMYVNSGKGIAITTNTKLIGFNLYLDIDENTNRVTCCACGDNIHGQQYHANYDVYCEYCFNEYYKECGECNQTVDRDDAVYSKRVGEDLCAPCLSAHYFHCEICSDWVHNDNKWEHEDKVMCSSCRDGSYTICDSCDTWHMNKVITHVYTVGFGWTGHGLFACPECEVQYEAIS